MYSNEYPDEALVDDALYSITSVLIRKPPEDTGETDT